MHTRPPRCHRLPLSHRPSVPLACLPGEAAEAWEADRSAIVRCLLRDLAAGAMEEESLGPKGTLPQCL